MAHLGLLPYIKNIKINWFSFAKIFYTFLIIDEVKGVLQNNLF